jgi:hypothetical protein
VTLFAGSGVTPIIDQASRGAESLARSFAGVLTALNHPKLVYGTDAVLVVSPEHARVFRQAGWSRERLVAELDAVLTVDCADIVKGAGGIDEGMPEWLAGTRLPKFRPGGLLVVQAGGTAGMFSAVIGGWVSGPSGSEPVTLPVRWP